MRSLYSIKYLIIANLMLTCILLLTEEKTVIWPSVAITLLIDCFCLYAYQKKVKEKTRENEQQITQGKRSTIILLQAAGTILFTIICLLANLNSSVFIIVNLLWALQLFGVYEISRLTSDFIYATFRRSRSVAIVGNSDEVHKLVPILTKRKQFDLKGYFDVAETRKRFEPAFAGAGHLGSFSTAVELSLQNNITELFVSPSGLADKHFRSLVDEAENNCIKVRIVESDSSLLESFRFKRNMNGLVINSRYKEPLSLLQNRIIKRVFDILLSSLAFVFVLSWLIPLVAILVKLESRGPIFFRQQRSGRNNKPFWCLKFRSMTPNSDANKKQAVRGDARITRVGAFLRKTSLDEMPQFINVLTGDMSICGPRPHMLTHTEEFSTHIKEYMARLYIKPGITGWAQINGYRGETSELMQMQKRVDYDIEYLQNWTLSNDLVIIARTVKFLFVPDENTF